jgi:hypothetical protein
MVNPLRIRVQISGVNLPTPSLSSLPDGAVSIKSVSAIGVSAIRKKYAYAKLNLFS